MGRAALPDALRWAGLEAQAAAIAAGKTTSAALVDAALAAIDAAQPELCAFRVVRHDAARAEAAAADRRHAAGERLPLLGVPVAIKDDTDLAGECTPFGCPGEWPVAETDAEVVRRLRAAGAVIVGKTTTPEIGQWPHTEGSFGKTRNPWSTGHTPGGSSGGSAAAVAAGLVAGAIGSDGAGSVRIPAGWTNLVGLKPQRGRISTMPHPESFFGLTCFGPLTRTVDDAALLLDVLSGAADGDRHTPPPPEEPFAHAARRDPGRLRIAVSFSRPWSATPRVRIHPEIRAATRRIAAVLADAGHEVFERDVSYGAVGPLFLPRSFAGIRREAALAPDPKLLDHRTRGNARNGALLGNAPVRAVARLLDGPLQRRIGAIFDHADVVLTPTTAQPPFPIGAFDGLSGLATDWTVIRGCPMTYAWNMTGWPGLNVPAGFTEDGLPIGVQLLGSGNDEARLLALGRQLEDVERWQDRRPPAA